MPWYSILPHDLTYLETWAARIFILLGLLTLLPWTALLAFDIGLYICRMILYEIPVVGGRARGAQRPRAPSLNERPRANGGRGVFGLRGSHAGRDHEGEKGDGGGTGVDIGSGTGIGAGTVSEKNKENDKRGD